jgi:hypothetical protein
MTRLRITQSLLSSFDWVFRKDDGYDSFLKALNREKEPPTEAMLDGIRFENCLNNVLTGVEIPKDHEWYTVITEMSAELQGAAQQVVLFSEMEVDGQPFLLHGVLDYLREGHIWDCKFSKRYGSNGKVNKYLTSPQTPMYFALVPEARDFTYIISDGKYVYREKYPRDTILPIEPEIRQFMRFCKEHGLWKIYEEKWSVAN